ncbi:MAG: hypothetical protein KDA57_24070 [Planctomycetales bacterium]|nr:hypothetical protein [Planctomycetales bacterium]
MAKGFSAKAEWYENPVGSNPRAGSIPALGIILILVEGCFSSISVVGITLRLWRRKLKTPPSKLTSHQKKFDITGIRILLVELKY